MQKAKKRVFSVTAVLLAVLVALTALLPTAGAAQAATMRSKYTGKSYTHNARFNKLEVLNGVDISAWQEKVNWKKIKNDGIDFAILRAGYGKKANQEDAYFATNFKNATAAGLPVGIYWYSYAKSVADVEKEARLCLQVLGSRTLDLPVFYDLEESSQLNKGKAFCTQLVEHFCSIIAAAGHTPGLYMSRSPLLDYIEQETRGRYALWVAEYGSKTCKYDGDYLMWQYADNGKVAGVNGNTDMDFLYGNKNSLPGSATLLKSKTYTGKAITPAPTVTGEDGQPLKADKDYTLTYINNKAVGMATITAQGLGTYTGRRWYYRFKILPAKVTGLTLESRSKTRLTYIWNATPGANAYLVKVINRTTGKGFDKAVSTTRVDLTDLTDTQLYEVQVAAYRGNTAYRGPYSKVNAKHALPGTVTGLKTQKTATGSITLEWNKKPGADGYVVYQYIAAKKQTKRLATTTARSFVFKGSGAKPGTKYYFYVAPYTVDSKTKEGAKGTQLATTTRPTATKCTAAKSAKKQQITVRWNKVKCNGYAVQYSTKKNFSGDKKTLYVNSGKATGNIKTAKGGRTYYVRLRPYTTVGNARYYGSYTVARAVRVK